MEKAHVSYSSGEILVVDASGDLPRYCLEALSDLSSIFHQIKISVNIRHQNDGDVFHIRFFDADGKKENRQLYEDVADNINSHL